MNSRLWRVFAIVALLCTQVRLPGQAISGDLVGTVTDSSGAALPNVTVTATNVGTNVKSTGVANGAGEYRISNLPPGAYEVSATAPGFATSTVRGVQIALNQTITTNLTLQVGTVASSVDVTAAAAAIDTTTAQIQNTYTTKQVEDLPNTSTGNGVINLSLLQAGVTSSGGVGVGTGPSIGGQRPRNNNFEVEGIDNNSKSVTGPVVFIPNDSVAEFTLLQNQFRAEYGHSSGGQFNEIIKSGTNEFHGQLYDYLRNGHLLNALDQTFRNQGITHIPRYDQNRLGANVGGPIFKNKLFFFTSFEYNPLGLNSTVGSPVYGLTAADFSALAAIPQVNKTNLGVLQQYGTASAATAGAPVVSVLDPNTRAVLATLPTGIIPINAPNYVNGYFGVLGMDYNISEKDQLRGRYLYNRSDAINTGATLPAFFTTVPSRFYLATLAEYHTFTPNITNEFRLGFQRSNSSQPVGSQAFPGLNAFPNLVFNDLGLQLGPNSNFPQASIVNLYQGTDAITWVRGVHTFKVGTEFRKYISPQMFSQRVRGDYEYTSVANYLLDQTPDYLAQRNIGGATYYGDQIASYTFLQDTWRVTKKFTADLGVRYEYTTVQAGIRAQALNAASGVPGLLTFHAPQASPYGIAPRVGFAYTPDRDGNTVIRAGFGIAYDVTFDNIGLLSVPPQDAFTVDVTGAGGSNFLANGGITGGGTAMTAAQTRAVTSAFLPDQKLPYSLNYSFDIQHVFAKNYTFDIRYVGTKGVHLITQQQIDRLSLVTPTNDIPTYLSAPSAATLASLTNTVGTIRAPGSLDPVYKNAGFLSTITSYQPEGYSQYNGLAVQLTRRFSNGLQYTAAYTWSHNIDNSTAEVASTYLTPRRAQDFRNLSIEKASSALDRRHRFTLSAIYDLPYFKGSSNWLVRNVIGNWEIAPVYTYESPEYYTVQSGVDSNLNNDAAPDRTIINTAGSAGTGSAVYGLDRNGNVIQPNAAAATVNNVVAWVAYNPNARYIQAGPGAYANAGRNTEPTRPIDNVNLSLYKRFTFRERMSLQLGADAFNLLNHPQYIPGALYDAGAVGTFNSSTLGYVDLTRTTTQITGSFNNPSLAFSSHPRVIQLVGKFYF